MRGDFGPAFLISVVQPTAILKILLVIIGYSLNKISYIIRSHVVMVMDDFGGSST